MRVLLAALLLLVVRPPLVHSQGRIPGNDPASARLILTDVENFWHAYDLVEQGADPEETYRKEYIEKGSPGLEAFMRLRIQSVEQLVETIAAHPRYYRELRQSTGRIPAMEPEIRKTFCKLAELHDEAVFPDVYFVVGRMNSAGTLAEIGLLVGVEMHGLTEFSPHSELSPWHRQVLKPVERIPNLVAHELIHYQQRYAEHPSTLLARSIQEGSADFIAELIAGAHINPHLHVYGDRREPQLFREFRRRMHRRDVTGWLYGGNASKDRPADLGYYMGYRICKAYYDGKEDKKQAVHDILHIQDFGEFFIESGYDGGRAPGEQ